MAKVLHVQLYHHHLSNLAIPYKNDKSFKAGKEDDTEENKSGNNYYYYWPPTQQAIITTTQQERQQNGDVDVVFPQAIPSNLKEESLKWTT